MEDTQVLLDEVLGLIKDEYKEIDKKMAFHFDEGELSICRMLAQRKDSIYNLKFKIEKHFLENKGELNG